MPLVSTIVASALEHLGILPVGQTANAEDSDKCLRALKSMLDARNLDPQAVIGLQELTLTPAAGTQSFTIGPAGSIVARQPLRIEPMSFYRLNGVDSPLGIATVDEYNAQASKSVTGPPQFVAMNRGYDTATVYLYPAADGVSQLRLWVQSDVVSGFDSLALTTNVTLPNGYQNDLEWSLAEEAATDFLVPDRILARVKQKASIAHRRVKRANTRVGELQMPAGISTRSSFNINEG